MGVRLNPPTLSIKDPAATNSLFHHRTLNVAEEVSRAAVVMARDVYLKHLSIALLGT